MWVPPSDPSKVPALRFDNFSYSRNVRRNVIFKFLDSRYTIDKEE